METLPRKRCRLRDLRAMLAMLNVHGVGENAAVACVSKFIHCQQPPTPAACQHYEYVKLRMQIIPHAAL